MPAKYPSTNMPAVTRAVMRIVFVLSVLMVFISVYQAIITKIRAATILASVSITRDLFDLYPKTSNTYTQSKYKYDQR